MITIDKNLQEYTVFQHTGGICKIALGGTCKEYGDNKPFIRIYNEKNNECIYESLLTVSDKRWQAEISLPIGFYRIETGFFLKGNGYSERYTGKGEILKHVFVGELFVIAGQSNAAGCAFESVADIPQYGVSCFCDGKWQVAAHPLAYSIHSSEKMSVGHSPWLKFAKLILCNDDIPVGLINTAICGSFISDWQKGKPLYRRLMKVLEKTNARNIIWYQGCSDANTGMTKNYYMSLDSIFTPIYKKHRAKIFFIQISGCTSAADNGCWRSIRESQREFAQEKKFPLIATYDLTNYYDDIHLGSEDNIRLAERVYAAYKGELAPVAIRAEKENGDVKILFNEQKRVDVAGDIVTLFDSKMMPIKTFVSPSEGELLLKPLESREAVYAGMNFDTLCTGEGSIAYNTLPVPFFFFKL